MDYIFLRLAERWPTLTRKLLWELRLRVSVVILLPGYAKYALDADAPKRQSFIIMPLGIAHFAIM